MKCEEVVNLIELYVAGEAEAKHHEVAEHLKTCSACARQVSALSGLSDQLKQTFQDLNPSADLTARILNKCLLTGRPRRRLSRLEIALTAVAAAVFIVVTIGLIRNLTEPVVIKPRRPLPQEYVFTDGSHMLIASNAVFDVKEAESRIVLHQGQLYFNLVPKSEPQNFTARKGEPPALGEARPWGWEVVTPAGTVTAYGTEFIVSVETLDLIQGQEQNPDTAQVSVLVLNGQVGLTNQKGQVVGSSDEYLYALYAEANSSPIKKDTSHQNLQKIIATMKELF